MDTQSFFIASDAALRSVVDRLRPEDLDREAPPEWTRLEHPTMRDILFAHTYDEAWIPDVLAGRSVQDGDPWRDADLLGSDPIASYDAVHDRAIEAVSGGVDQGSVLRFQYGDYPAEEGLAHMAMYRATQAWDIARLLQMPFHLPDEVLDGLEEHVLPQADQWRAFGVFPPAVDAPADADRETRLMCAFGRTP